jgi:formylglycine-generating enzyme required for sulfatase activity
MGVHEVTQGQYQAVMGDNPSFFSSQGGGMEQVAGRSTDQYPVETVSWVDAVTFCNKLSMKEGLKPFYTIAESNVRVLDRRGLGYRLPTEAEWEYCCRAGTNTQFSFGNDPARMGEFSWSGGSKGEGPHPVGQKPPNAWGLFDMHGNIWEWCGDWHNNQYYTNSPPDDPPGPAMPTGHSRVIRGGGYDSPPKFSRASLRGGREPDRKEKILGFRVARTEARR